MKRIDEMTRDEVVALTDEQIQTAIDLEIAYAGITPVLLPTYEIVPTIDLKKNDSCYKVHGCLLRSKEDAETLSKMEIMGETYEYGVGYDYKYLTEPETSTVSVEKFYSHTDILNMVGTLKVKKQVEERNAIKRKEYTEYEGKTKEIVDHVNAVVSAARDFNAKVEYAKKIFERHLTLAEGNRGIATNFFKTAYNGQAEIIGIVLNEEPLFKEKEV